MKTESDYKPLPPPSPAETHNNTRTKIVRVPVTRKSPEKRLVQCNNKVRPHARDQFEEAYGRAKSTVPGANGKELTKGDFFELLLAVYKAKESGTDNLVEAAKALTRSPEPSTQDLEDGRTELLEVFATPDLAGALRTRAKQKRWTLSTTIENACAEGLEFSRIRDQPCPHCGKARTDAAA